MSKKSETTKQDRRKYAEEIVKRLKSAGFKAYFVGGCVRDFIRGEIPGDYDIATSALPEQIIALFDHTVGVGKKFGVVVVVEKNF
ncbi:MAG: hypothetical protein WBJ43_07885, partial [Smithellaceae bacterium]